MMCAILDIETPDPSTLAYADDMNESAAAITITTATHQLGRRFQQYCSQARNIGLNFDLNKTKLMHISVNRRYKTDTSIPLPVQTPDRLTLIQPSQDVKVLSVILDLTLSFLPHAQYASSRGLQALGSLLYLRKGDGGIAPVVARQFALSKILPTMIWAPPAWWNGPPYVLTILERPYLRVAQWITGLPLTTSTAKLRRCAHLPQLQVLLDFVSAKYVSDVRFDYSSRNLVHLLPDQPYQTRYGFCRSLHPTAALSAEPMEQKSPIQKFSIPLTQSTFKRPKNKEEAATLVKGHRDWKDRLGDNTWVAYTEGSQSADGDNGAGWFIERKSNGNWITECMGSCNLGKSAEVIDSEAHAVVEALEFLHRGMNPQRTL
jgi:hypothetical protein